METVWLPLRDVVAALDALEPGGWNPQRARRLIDAGYLYAVRRFPVGPGASHRLVSRESLDALVRVLGMADGLDRDRELRDLRAQVRGMRGGGSRELPA